MLISLIHAFRPVHGAVLALTLVASAGLTLTGCITDEESDETYYCVYESRSSACGGGNYSAWEQECFETTSDCSHLKNTTSCGGSCCIYVEYRNVRRTTSGC